jgi:hypothetical protein
LLLRWRFLDKFATRLAALTAPHAPIAWEALKQDH